MAAAGCSNDPSALLQGQPDAEGAIDRADDLALPAQHGGVPPQETADLACAHREHGGAEKPQQDENDAEQSQLQERRAALRPHELRQESEEEKRRFRIEQFRENGLLERACGRELWR